MYDIDNEYGQQFKGNLLAGILNQLTKEARQDALKNPIVESYVVGEIASNMHRKPYPVFNALKCKLKKEYNEAKLDILSWKSYQYRTTFEEMLRVAMKHEMEATDDIK